MEHKDICTRKTYLKDGNEKVVWLKCGTMRVNEDGKTFVELNHLPGITFYIFDQKKKETGEQGEAF